MTLTIEVSPELENRIEAEARNNGVGRDEFVRIVLEEKLNLQKSRLLPADFRNLCLKRLS